MTRLRRYLWLGGLPLAVAALNLMLVLYPAETVGAAREGVRLWYERALPSLLPFMVGANLLSALGALDFVGAAAEPVARRLFGVSGRGACAVAFGMAGGYPMGAKVACEMRVKGQVSRAEGARLLAFCNNSGPMFIVGAAGAGMFGSAQAGYLLLAAHWGGALALGLFGRLRAKEMPPAARSRVRYVRTNVPFGQLLSQAMGDAVETVLKVGGFITLFCVVAKALDLVGAYGLAEAALAPIMPGANGAAARGALTGAIEMTNGLAILGGEANKAALAAAAAVISFGGFSVHAQSLAFIAKTDLPAAPYLLAKAAHAALSAILALLLYPVFAPSIHRAAAVFAPLGAAKQALGATIALCAGFGLLTLCAILAGLCKTLNKRP